MVVLYYVYRLHLQMSFVCLLKVIMPCPGLRCLKMTRNQCLIEESPVLSIKALLYFCLSRRLRKRLKLWLASDHLKPTTMTTTRVSNDECGELEEFTASTVNRWVVKQFHQWFTSFTLVISPILLVNLKRNSTGEIVKYFHWFFTGSPVKNSPP